MVQKIWETKGIFGYVIIIGSGLWQEPQVLFPLSSVCLFELTSSAILSGSIIKRIMQKLISNGILRKMMDFFLQKPAISEFFKRKYELVGWKFVNSRPLLGFSKLCSPVKIKI